MVTIKDVAREAGVSYSAVSYVLNGKAKERRISSMATKRVMAAADRLGYQRNEIAKSIVTGKTNVLAVIVPDLADPFYSEFLSLFKQNAAPEGFDVVVYDYELDPQHEQRCLERILSGYYDASVAFISSFAHTGEIVRKLWNARIPLVTIGTPHEFDKDLKYDTIMLEYDTSISGILKIVRRQNRKKVLFAASKIAERTISFLDEILRDKFQAAGFDFSVDSFVQLPKSSGNQAEDGLLLGRKIFAEVPEADVIIVWNGFQAYGLLRAAHEAGKKIPEDIIIIVRDNTWISKYSIQPLFSIDQRLDIMAQKSFDFIKKRLATKNWEETFTMEVPGEAVYPETIERNR